MATILTIEEFRATRQGPLPDIRMIMGFDDDPPIAGYTYEGPCGICLDKDEKPYLVIYNQEWNGTLEYLEEVLYREFYLPEICGQSNEPV